LISSGIKSGNEQKIHPEMIKRDFIKTKTVRNLMSIPNRENRKLS